MKLSELIEQYKDHIQGNMVMVVRSPTIGMGFHKDYSFIYQNLYTYSIDAERGFCPVIYPEPTNYEFVGIINFNNLKQKYPRKWGN